MANTRYENFVLENELKDQLNTRLNMRTTSPPMTAS